MTTSPEPGDARGAPARDGIEAPPADLSRRVLQRCEDDLALLARRNRRRTRLALSGLAALGVFTLALHLALEPRTQVAPLGDALAAGTAPASGHEAAAGAAEARATAVGDLVADVTARSGTSLRASSVAAPSAASSAVAFSDPAARRRATGVAVQLAPGAGPVPDGAAHWLASALRSDGRFLGGGPEVPRADEVGLHAFALLALASAGPSPATQRENADAALLAARWLLEQQDEDGSIGAPVGAGFDHALGTVALLEAGALTGDAPVRAAADRAVALIAERQALDGGWQPRVAGLPGGSPAQTAWTLAALLRAQQLGTPDLERAIARGQSRLAADLAGDVRDGGSRGPAVAAADLDLAAVRAVALGSSRSRAATPAGGLYAASLAVLAAPAIAR
ncbi:MAG TPA: hypothetical protein VK824_05685 [Planctomycetota bacterium]|nr:hypothetical protein [Planctomycetota bacterium]